MSFWGLIGFYVGALALSLAVARLRIKIADAGAHFPGLHYAKYALGAFLGVTVLLVVLVLASAASCTDGTRSAAGFLELSADCPATARWYPILTDWQSGIGAFVGLLGLAWSTLLKALMDKKPDPDPGPGDVKRDVVGDNRQ